MSNLDNVALRVNCARNLGITSAHWSAFGPGVLYSAMAPCGPLVLAPHNTPGPKALQPALKSLVGDRTKQPRHTLPHSETVARMDAGPKPTWMYLRRVSEWVSMCRGERDGTCRMDAGEQAYRDVFTACLRTGHREPGRT